MQQRMKTQGRSQSVVHIPEDCSAQMQEYMSTPQGRTSVSAVDCSVPQYVSTGCFVGIAHKSTGGFLGMPEVGASLTI
jgi:hypothetical protein